MIKDNIENKTLSIRISTDGFCFCSYTPSLPSSLKYFFYKPEKDLTLTTNLQKGIELCPFVSDNEKYNIKVIIEAHVRRQAKLQDILSSLFPQEREPF